MASPLGWHKYVTDEGDIIAMHTLVNRLRQMSLFKLFGFTVDNVVNKAKALL